MSNNGLLSEALGKGDRLDVRSPSDFTICTGMSEVMTVRSETVFLLFHEKIINLEKL